VGHWEGEVRALLFKGYGGYVHKHTSRGRAEEMHRCWSGGAWSACTEGASRINHHNHAELARRPGDRAVCACLNELLEIQDMLHNKIGMSCLLHTHPQYILLCDM
jgi:hypothetical protein